MSLTQAVDALVDYETVPDDVDQNLGKPGFVGDAIGRRVLGSAEYQFV